MFSSEFSTDHRRCVYVFLWLVSRYFHRLKYNLVVLDCHSWWNKRSYLWNPFYYSLCHKCFYSENTFYRTSPIMNVTKSRKQSAWSFQNSPWIWNSPRCKPAIEKLPKMTGISSHSRDWLLGDMNLHLAFGSCNSVFAQRISTHTLQNRKSP